MTAPAPASTEDLLQFLYEMPFGVVKFRVDGTVDLMNPAAAALLLSLRVDDDLCDLFASLAPLAPDLAQRVTAHAAATGVVVGQQRLETRAGNRASVLSLTVNKLNNNDFVAVLRDLTTQVEQERRLSTDRQKFFAIFDHVLDYAIYTITREGKIEEWNQSLRRYGGWLAEDVVGRDIGLFMPLDDPNRPDIDQLLAETMRVGSKKIEGSRVNRDGVRFWESMVITALPEEAGLTSGFVVVARNITERKRAEDDIRRLATVDPLTGAYNRRQGEVLLAAEFDRRARDRRDFAVLILDIDHFKAINDRFGHSTGDAALRAMVRASQNALRVIDMLARWGGEEFLVLLPDTDENGAVVAAERLRTALEAMEIEAPEMSPLRITVSVGVAVPRNDDREDLLHRADAALYAAKRGGRNKVVLAA